MGTRRRLSSESSSYSLSSGTSYYGCGSGSVIISDDEDITDINHCTTRNSGKSRTLFDDVKVILSRHDSKLSKMEDDFSCVVRWLNEKFDFILKYESTSSIPSMWEEHDHINDERPRPVLLEEQDNLMLNSPPTSNITPVENESFSEEVEVDADNGTQGPAGNNSLLEHHDISQEEEDKGKRLSPCLSSSGTNNGGGGNNVAQRYMYTENELVPVSPVAKCMGTNPIHHNDAIEEPVRNIKRKRAVKPKGLQSATTVTKDTRPSQCDKCGKFLKDQTSLRQHKKIHLNIRPYTCSEPDCGKSFRRKFHLQTHALIHKGVKDHQCGYCGRCFLLHKDLITHERIHTGERPFNCPDCPKSFTLKSHLVMHLRTHTGEKPYKCGVCDKTFAQSNTLRLHKKKIHPETSGLPTTRKPVSRKKKATGKAKEKIPVGLNTAASPIASTSSLFPAKLPIYRNQPTLLTAYRNIPSISRITPTITILQPQQPIITNHSFELLEPGDTINVDSSNELVLTDSTINMFSTLSPSGENNEVLSSEILNFPQHVLIPRNNHNL